MGLDAKVISSGELTSDLAIVSTGPGAAELRTGVPFSGGAGNLLWSTLRPLGWNRANVYTTNVVKNHSGDDGNKIPKGEFDLWTELLFYELRSLPHLQYILILGGEALKALTKQDKIMKWRGSIVEVDLGHRSVRAVVAVNPAMVLRSINILKGEEYGTLPMRSAKLIFQYDLRKLKKVVDGKLGPYEINHLINPSFSEALDFLDHVGRHDGPVAYDIETFNGETACIGLAASPHEGMCINFIEGDGSSRWEVEQEIQIRTKLKQVLQHPRLVAQNSIYDDMWLWYKDRIKVHAWYDTMLAHHLLYPGLPHSLAFLTSRYTTHPYYKDDKDFWKALGDPDRFWRYNVTDACITLAVQGATARELEKEGLADLFYNHVMRAHKHLTRMCVAGIKIDLKYKEHLREQLERELHVKLDDFHRAVQVATGEPDYRPNPRSPTQVGELLFRKLRLVGRGTSTDDENRGRILHHPRTGDTSKDVIKALNTYLTEAKFYSTYVNSRADPDGRIRTEYKQTGTTKVPGRLSSSQTPWETGMNLQNQPERAYPMFCCEPGYGMVYIDGAQAEARVVAWIAPVPRWIEQFERARLNPGTFDAHRALAVDMWKMRYEDVPVKDYNPDGTRSLRYIAKRCRHGLNYRMQAARLADTTGLSLGDATDAFKRYHRSHPEIKAWWRSIEEEARRTGVLYNLIGRRWVLTEIITETTLESIVAFVPQSTVGDHVVRAIYLIEDDDGWPTSARCALDTHDGLIAIAPISKLEHCARIMIKHMEVPLRVPGQPPLIIPAEAKITKTGVSWKVNDNGQVEWYNDDQGLHRWSHLSTL